VQREINPLWGEKKVILRQTPRAVTPFGGLSVFIAFLQKIGYRQQVSEHMPVHLHSPNAINPGETFTAFLISVVAGARRFAHTAVLRTDKAVHALLGIQRFPSDDTIRNLFKRFRQGLVVQFYEPLWAWQLARVPQRAGGYSLDLDSTVFERYGEQEGVKRGYNPRKHGRPSPHPLLAVLGEAGFILHGWLRSGNTRSDSGVVEFLQEAWAKLESREWIRVVRADSGFFAQELLRYLEGLELHYIVVARLTKWLKREAARVEAWRALNEIYAGGEFRLKLLGGGPGATLRGGAGAIVRDQALAGAEAVGGSRLHLSGIRDQSIGCTGGDLARLQPARVHRATHRRVEVGLGGG